ncbi:MAG: 4Fe-4S dicluster domain-containing protein [Desulfosarcina sp.]|nr:4Fe-4S dicluster domain-containing protein [Desulfobacterales bacterium]
MDRRTFIKIAGMGSISFAAGCSPDPDRKLFTLVHAPDNMVTGQPQWYASTCRECPSGCGLIAKNREGRVIKLEGNPSHPVNRGKLCMRGQAALQGVYDPDRIRSPQLKENGRWRTISFSEAEAIMHTKTAAAARRGTDRVRFLTDVMGATLQGLARTALANWNSDGPTVFEPFAYESLKTANAAVFGIDGLFAYRMQDADVLVSFGADFLETWLSPVEYARRFKAMHGLHQNRKGLFFQVSPFQSLTGANADAWLACRPGTEAVVALGMLQVALDVGRADHLPYSLRRRLEDIITPFTRENVVDRSSITAAQYDQLANRLFQAENPLVLGTGAAAAGMNSLPTDLAVNLLNRILNPEMPLLEFGRRYRVETAARRSAILDLLRDMRDGQADVVLVHNANPVYALAPASEAAAVFEQPRSFVISLSGCMDETAARADLILPVRLPLETWDEYGTVSGATGIQQPAMGRLTEAPALGDLLLRTAFDTSPPATNYKAYLAQSLKAHHGIFSAAGWVRTFQTGGLFSQRVAGEGPSDPSAIDPDFLDTVFGRITPPPRETVFIAAPSIRFLDGRGANRAWLNEIPDSLTQVTWQSPVVMHPETAVDLGTAQGQVVALKNKTVQIEAPVYTWAGVAPGVLMMTAGMGHSAYGRFARNRGANPFQLLPAATGPLDGAPVNVTAGLTIQDTGKSMRLAHIDGSRIQHDRKIALSIPLKQVRHGSAEHGEGLTMWDFPLTLPIPEGYDARRDFYPPHDHKDYRWAMVVDLDRCIGCNACAAACYAENNIGIVHEERILEGREMAWLQIQRYLDEETGTRVTFLPMMCQHCDNAPCEAVCPVYAPHHSKEGLNNQIYNRCIGTRFCSQNCPYKVRRFNWYTWQWPQPLDLQLNPDVTVRAKGVMEKCSFCIQRIKSAHNLAKNEKRAIRDGEVVTACMQTCPTDAITFGSLMDPETRGRKLVDDPRAYQVMGYVNTKPAVIYLKKVVQEV